MQMKSACRFRARPYRRGPLITQRPYQRIATQQRFSSTGASGALTSLGHVPELSRDMSHPRTSTRNCEPGTSSSAVLSQRKL